MFNHVHPYMLSMIENEADQPFPFRNDTHQRRDDGSVKIYVYSKTGQ